MNTPQKSHHSIEKKSIFIDILLTIFTLGLWNLWVQIRQISHANTVLERREFPSILGLIFFTLITFGIYFCYHEYKLTQHLHLLVYKKRDTFIEILAAVGAFFGLWFLVDSYQQSLLNRYLEENN